MLLLRNFFIIGMFLAVGLWQLGDLHHDSKQQINNQLVNRVKEIQNNQQQLEEQARAKLFDQLTKLARSEQKLLPPILLDNPVQLYHLAAENELELVKTVNHQSLDRQVQGNAISALEMEIVGPFPNQIRFLQKLLNRTQQLTLSKANFSKERGSITISATN